MKTLLKINWLLVTLLSIATGAFKVFQQEADITLFKSIGFTEGMTLGLGIIQLIGGILLIAPKTRKTGAFVMIPTFIIASIAVFANGMMVFSVVSLLFIAMAGLVILMGKRANNKYQ